MRTRISELKQVKLLSYVYDVKWEDPKQSPLVTGTGWGYINNVTSSIHIDDKLTQKEQILIHEVTHLISDCFDVKLNESQVSRMSEGFYHFLLANDLIRTGPTTAPNIKQ